MSNEMRALPSSHSFSALNELAVRCVQSWAASFFCTTPAERKPLFSNGIRSVLSSV